MADLNGNLMHKMFDYMKAFHGLHALNLILLKSHLKAISIFPPSQSLIMQDAKSNEYAAFECQSPLK